MGFFSRKKSVEEDVKDNVNFVMNMHELDHVGKYVEELELIEKSMDKKHESYWYTKGNVLSNLDRADEAIKCYRKATKIDGKYIKAYYRLGQRLFELGNLEADKMFIKVVELEHELGINEWTDPSCFYHLLQSDLVYKEFGNASDLKIRNDAIQILRGIVDYNEKITDDEFVNYCHNHSDELLDKLEPKPIVDFRIQKDLKDKLLSKPTQIRGVMEIDGIWKKINHISKPSRWSKK